MPLVLSRRGLLAASTALGLSACTTATTNGVTTVTINVPVATAYISGIAALASAFLGIPGIGAALGVGSVALINTVISDINSAVPALGKASGNSLTFSFSTTSVPAFVGALEADMGTVLKDAQAALGSFGKTVPQTVQLYYNALVSVANALSGLFGIAPPAAAVARAAAPMPVDQALALVHISVPG